ncbi:glycosyltransferase [Novosphingobium resinovorum]|uniref:glycosyltransferase n=1 Tax=Novosphingobium resinovorum TaxID=158500 RepID=UPI002ED5C122|nr:glycosyltransferase [Novosphingobium resinovorum]
MRLVIDLQALQNDSRHRGIGRHTRDFTAALIRIAQSHEIILLCNAGLPAIAEEVRRDLLERAGADVTILEFAALAGIHAQNPENAGRAGVARIIYEKLLADLRPDVVLTSSTIEGFLDDTVGHGGHFTRAYALGSIFYDLIPLSDPDLYLPGERVRAWFDECLSALCRNDFLLTNSDTSRDEAIALLGFAADHVHSPGSAVDTRLFASGARPDPAMLQARFGITGSYVMHAGTFEPRKNYETLLREFARVRQSLRSQTQLVFVCAPPEPALARLFRLARRAGLGADQLVVTGQISDTELVALYSGATVFAFPSLREGFGLPPLEAMSCGTATIASDNSSLPEVIGWNEALFDPLREGDLARLLTKALGDDAFRRRLEDHARQRSALFDWQRSACRALQSLEREAGARSPLPAAGTLPNMDAVLDRIADLHGAGGLSPADIRDAADALAENERIAMLHLAPAKRGGAQSWRMEGPFDSSYSLALVNRELARAVGRFGHEIALISADGDGAYEPDADFLAANPDVDRMADARRRSAPHTCAFTVHSRNVYPPHVDGMVGDLRSLHGYAWEETAFPHDSVREFNTGLDLILVTSSHVEKVLIDNGVTTPISVCGLGVDHFDVITPASDFHLDAREFRFLHVSSGLDRKGLDLLLDAFARSFTSADPVSLVIKITPAHAPALDAMLQALRTGQADFPDVITLEEDLSPAELKALHRQCHVAVYPTRAEGFGLPIAEAAACGIPVIASAWSGHMDFCSAADMWLVDCGFAPSRSHLGLAGSAWAAPDPAMLRARLREAFASSPEQRADMAARAHRRTKADQNWRIVAARHIAHIRDQAREAARGQVRDRTRIGWISTWGEACGIATYSRHLLAHFAGPITILAREGADPSGCGPHRVIPLWTRPVGTGLIQVTQIADRRHFDVIVIQFGFAFFDQEDLSALVTTATRGGVAVVIEMHATALPAAEGGCAVLLEMKDTLARCARILVHSTTDLNRLAAIGLVDNVTLFSHGLPPIASGTGWVKRQFHDLPLIASFGFALPHKGLVELVESAALLRDAGAPVRLLLLNAEFPDPASRDTIARIRESIDRLGLSDLVTGDFTFRREEDIQQALADADLIVFPYQQTDESASGAVRHAVASGRPLAVTPIPIFSELEGIAHMLDGLDPAAIADGIARILAASATPSTEEDEQRERAADHALQLGFDRMARRLEDMCTALAQRMPPLVRSYPASAPELRTTTPRGALGVRGQSVLVPQGDSLTGPDIRLVPARYAVTVEGALPTPSQTPPVIIITPPSEDGGCYHRSDSGGFVWSTTIAVCAQSAPFNLSISPAGPDPVQIDSIALHPQGGSTLPPDPRLL